MKKPKGVTILASMILVFNGMSILWITLMMHPELRGSEDHGEPLFVGAMVFSMIASVVFAIGAISLLKYQEWGRRTVNYATVG